MPRERDATLSFPSGHASMAFASAMAGYQILREHPSSPLAQGFLITGLTQASLIAAFRVAASKHYLSDVIAGAALGVAMGAMVPHFRRDKRSAGVDGSSPIVSFGGSW